MSELQYNIADNDLVFDKCYGILCGTKACDHTEILGFFNLNN